MIRYYDTAQRRLVDWQPPEHVRIYVCGITPYDAAHLGHILTFMTYDLLERYLIDQGHQVTMVRNVTDVDEPIFRKAAELGVSYDVLASQETASFQAVLARLNFKTPAHQPLASQYIEEMASAVQQLLDNGTAYYIDDPGNAATNHKAHGRDVYFDTIQDPAFGSFSGFDERLRLGLLRMRGGDPERTGKRHPSDFMLWRAVNDVPDQPIDPAAWTTAAYPAVPHGRPGWHIECSVMSAELLGLPFDLHGGGSDLIFPHHEAEIAQSRALNTSNQDPNANAPLAAHWLHVAPLDYCGEKMSKSLGNLVFARDLLETHEGSVIRLALMKYHYRTGGEWIPGLLDESVELLACIRTAYDHGTITTAAAERFGHTIRQALADDLDTHAIWHALCDLAQTCRRCPAENVRHSPETASNEQSIVSLVTDFELLGLVLVK